MSICTRAHSFSDACWVGAIAVIWDVGLVLKIFVRSSASGLGLSAHSSQKLSKVALMSFSSMEGLWVVGSGFWVREEGPSVITWCAGRENSNAGGSSVFSMGEVIMGVLLGNSGGSGR